MRKKVLIALVCIAAVLLLSCVVLIILVLTGVISKSENDSSDIQTGTIVYDGQQLQEGVSQNELPSASASTKYPGDYMKITVSKDSREILMANYADNLTYVKYQFYYGDNLLVETGKIAPGEAIPVDLFNYLNGSGEYKLTLKCCPYAIEDKNIAYPAFYMDSTVTVQ